MTMAFELTEKMLDDFLKNSTHKYMTTHRKLCYAIIKRIHKRLLKGYRFGTITVCHTKSLVIDGNHKFVAYSLAGIDIEVQDSTSNPSDVPTTYNEVKIDTDQDWDFNDPKRKYLCDDDFLKDLP